MVNYKRGSGNYKSSYLQIAIKDISQSISTQTSFQDDAELHLPVRANKRYAGYIMVHFTSIASADIKFGFAAVTGAVVELYSKGIKTSPVSTVTFGSSTINQTDGNVQMMFLPFTLRMGTSDGELQFQFAQGTSDGASTTVHRGSMLLCFEA